MLLGTLFAIQISGRHSEALKVLRDHRLDLVVILEPDETWRRFAGSVAQQIPPPKILVVAPPETESWGGLERPYAGAKVYTT